MLLYNYGIRNGTKLYVDVNIESGQIRNFRAITRYVHKMSPQEVRDFFEAKHTVCINIPMKTGIETLEFSLE